MTATVLDAYNTLSVEAQKEVEHLIYFLVSQRNKEVTSTLTKENILDSFIGKCNSWKGMDAMEYQRKLKAEDRV